MENEKKKQAVAAAMIITVAYKNTKSEVYFVKNFNKNSLMFFI